MDQQIVDIVEVSKVNEGEHLQTVDGKRIPIELSVIRRPAMMTNLQKLVSSSKSCNCLNTDDGQYGRWKADTNSKMTNSTPCLLSSNDDISISCFPDTSSNDVTLLRTVRYRNFRIKVYKRLIQQPAIRKALYYYEPVVLLDPNKIDSRSIVSCPTGTAYVCLNVQMWNDEIQQAVADRLRCSTSELEDEDDVQVMPYKDVRLFFKSTGYSDFWNGVSLPEDASTLSYHQLDQALEFYLLCPSKTEADMLVREMKANPGFSTRQLALECKSLSFDTTVDSCANPYSVLFSLHVTSSVPTTDYDAGTLQSHYSNDDPSNYPSQGISHLNKGVINLCDALQRRLNEAESLCRNLQEQMNNYSRDSKKLAILSDRTRDAVPVFGANRLHRTIQTEKYVTYDMLEFETEKEYGTLDMNTGTFTVSIGGIYLFLFHGLSWGRVGGTRVELRVGGISRAASYACDPGEKEQALVVMSAILKLNPGEEVGVFLEKGILCDGPPLYTWFSGIFFNQQK